jgi:hypothetical protein
MAALVEGCRLLVAAMLTGAGYHRHDRGAWRRRRARVQNTLSEQAST